MHSDEVGRGIEQIAALKRQAAHHAVRWIHSGMVVGLGSGSTARYALERIGELVKSGVLKDLVGVPTSQLVAGQARQLQIPLCHDDDLPAVDMTIDGADEVDPALDIIKGGGGALVREKLVAQVSRREVIIIDEMKLSVALGSRHSLPIEVLPFGWKSQQRFIEDLGACVSLRMDARCQPYLTDQRNLILDAAFGPIADKHALASRLEGRSGVVGHGLFLDLATDVVIAGPGGIRHLEREAR